jgi:hypothetical protein
MGQEIAAVILLLERNERIVNDVGTLSVQGLTDGVADALVLRVLSPLGPIASSSPVILSQYSRSKETGPT